jgi:hypothetical protein
MPFRFGAVTIEAIASSTLALEMMVDGKPVTGYASELLAYKWFDKRPEKTPRDNINDLLDTLNAALDSATQLGDGSVFEHWRTLDKAVHAHALGRLQRPRCVVWRGNGRTGDDGWGRAGARSKHL